MSHMSISVLFAYVTLLCCIVLQQQPMHHFHTPGLDCEQMAQWFLIDLSFVLEDGIPFL